MDRPWEDTIAYLERAKWWDTTSSWGVNNVLDQSRPFNRPGGIRIGRFDFAPTLDTRLVYDDNIFNLSSNAKGDFYTEITPGISVSTETARHYFKIAADLKAYKYATYDAFDALDRSLAASGAVNVNSAHVIYGSVGHALIHEDNLSYIFPDLDGTRETTAEFDAGERTPVTVTHGQAGIRRDGGRLWASLGARYGHWDYQDIRSTAGNNIDQDYRDLRSFSGEVQVGYRFSPGFELLGQVTSRRLDFLDQASAYADGWRHEVSAGLEFETGPLLQWQLSGGYAQRTFDDPAYDSTGDYTARLVVNWAATERMTLKGEARRQLSLVTSETSIGATLAHAFRVSGDFELYRNVIFTINGEYWDVKDLVESDDSELYRAGIRLQYISTRNWIASVGYDYVQRQSDDDALDLERNQFWGRVQIRF